MATIFKYFIAALALAFVISSASGAPRRNDDDDDNDADGWQTWKTKQGRTFSNSNEDNQRRMNYRQTLEFVKEHNRKHDNNETDFEVKLNDLADLSPAEIATRYGYKGVAGDSRQQVLLGDVPMLLGASLSAAPASIDWRTQGAVTPVKNQGSCGSCWSFSATGALEGRRKIKTGSLVSLSEKNLMDCSWSYGNQGCNGGWMNSAFKYVRSVNGINTGAAYPYQPVSSQTCKVNKTASALFAPLSSTIYVNVPAGNETALMLAVAAGPVAVAIDASRSTFSYYKSGVYSDTSCSKTSLNHAVLIVGYGTDTSVTPNKPYWIVKNSWGTGWGNQGYILMARGSNVCGIAAAASYPVLL